MFLKTSDSLHIFCTANRFSFVYTCLHLTASNIPMISVYADMFYALTFLLMKVIVLICLELREAVHLNT